MTADEPVPYVPRRCARRADCTRPRGHDDECGPDRDQARAARYAAALSSARLDAVLAVADTELAEARADVERLMEVAEVLVAQVADRLAERDALQRQVDDLKATVGVTVLATEWACGGDGEDHEWGGKDRLIKRVLTALDAVEPADQPTEDPVVTEAKRRCAEYRASLPAGVSTEATWQDWAPGGFYYEPADQPHPTPEAWVVYEHEHGRPYTCVPATRENAEREAELAGQGHTAEPADRAEAMRNAWCHGRMVGHREAKRQRKAKR